MQPANLTHSLLSSAERPLMPSWEWSIAFKVAWKSKTWQDCSGIEAAPRSQVRTASGCHRACGETDYQEQQSSVPFSPTSRALKSQTSGRSQRWHWDMQAGVPHHCDISQSHQNRLFFSLVYPCFFLPQSPMQSPSSTIILLWQEQPNTSAQSQTM